MTFIPSEFAIGGVYFPPLLIAAIAGLLLASLTTRLLNRYRLSRCFFYPPPQRTCEERKLVAGWAADHEWF
jgi:hypothetical protein